MNDNEIENELQSKGLTAPRITPADIEENIANAYFFTARQGVNASGVDYVISHENYQSLNLLTFCVLILNNGFIVTGESACVSPENFDAEMGRKIARQNAVNKIWTLMGYALKEKLSNQ